MTSGNSLRIFGTALGCFGRLLFFLFDQRFHRLLSLGCIKLMNILNHCIGQTGNFSNRVSNTASFQSQSSVIVLQNPFAAS